MLRTSVGHSTLASALGYLPTVWFRRADNGAAHRWKITLVSRLDPRGSMTSRQHEATGRSARPSFLMAWLRVLLLCLVAAVLGEARPGFRTREQDNYIEEGPAFLPELPCTTPDCSREMPLNPLDSRAILPLPLSLSKRNLDDLLLASGDDWMRDLRPANRKRQIRYHQCYFNPISCFKK